MVIAVDSREKRPYDFLSQAGDITTITATLPIGDYSLQGCFHLIALERKSMADLANCLGNERERFTRELMRARSLESFCVIVEGSYTDVLNGNWGRSKLNPASAIASIQAYSSRLHIPFIFTGNRANGEAFAAGFLRQWLKGKVKEQKAFKAALDVA